MKLDRLWNFQTTAKSLRMPSDTRLMLWRRYFLGTYRFCYHSGNSKRIMNVFCFTPRKLCSLLRDFAVFASRFFTSHPGLKPFHLSLHTYRLVVLHVWGELGNILCMENERLSTRSKKVILNSACKYKLLYANQVATMSLYVTVKVSSVEKICTNLRLIHQEAESLLI